MSTKSDGSEPDFDGEALSYLQKHGATSVYDLYVALVSQNPKVTLAEVVNIARRLKEEGHVNLDDPSTAVTFGGYLRLWERNLLLYVALIVSLLTTLVIYALPSDYPLVGLRWVLGCAFVLFIPGYVAVEALFPETREMDSIERIALSVGLSLALVPLVGLLLNFTPWGISLLPIVVALNVLTFTLAAIALARKYSAAKKKP